MQEWLTRDPNFLLEPVRQNAAIVFIDLSGFTSLSEQLGPDRIRELLKDFHALVDKQAVTCGGMITSFLGDGAMILFGLPVAAPDDAFRAAKCSVGLCFSAEQWLASLPQSTVPRLGFKVGAHFGTIVASRLGGGSYHHVTATGDTVNVASRLMEVAANHGVQLAVSNELLRTAGSECAAFKSGALTGPIDTQIRGRSRHARGLAVAELTLGEERPSKEPDTMRKILTNGASCAAQHDVPSARSLWRRLRASGG